MNLDRRPDALSAFVPGWLLQSLADDPARPRAEAATETLAATLLADITGFTALAEKLDEDGPSGAERLAGILDGCFVDLLDTVLDHGGDILRFAGDALLVLFPAKTEAQLPRAVHLAARCAQAAHELMPRHGAGDTRLRLRVGIAAGAVRLSDVGGEQGRWEFLAAGAPILDMAVAERAASPGETVLADDAARLVADVCELEALRDGGHRVRAIRPVALPRYEPPASSPELERAVRAYLPSAVLRRIDAGQGRWLSEFRDVTVLFINLTDPALRIGKKPAELQRAFRVIQSALFRHDGDSSQLVVDDKGVVTVAAFGLPMHAHENDARRALDVARAIDAALAAQGVPHSIGVASGRVFCGTYGKAHRREAVTVGRAVNLASRIADAAAGGVLCDATTARRAGSGTHFEALAPVAVKGSSRAVQVLRPVGDAPAERPEPQARMVGREQERAQLDEVLAHVTERGGGLTLLIEGEPGIGKSALADHFLLRAAAAGITGCRVSAQELEQALAYGVWRSVLSRLLGLDVLADPSARASRVRAYLQSNLERRDWAPLLNGVLPVAFAETEVVRQMQGALRGPNTRDLLLQILQEFAEDRPLILVLDDMHWMDSSSWELAELARRRLPRLILVLAGRSPTEEAPEALRVVREDVRTLRLQLDRMPADKLLALVCRQLQVTSLPLEVARLVCAKAEGHPLFGVELACALRDAGHIAVAGGECVLVAEAAELETLDLPSTVQGLLNSRFDRLTPQQQLTLKVSSVIGRIFPYEVLQRVHPVERDRVTLPAQLDVLEQRDLTIIETPWPNAVYAFRHVLIQEAAYNLLAFAQRRELHQAVAEHHERALAGAGPTLLPVLAHHWRQAAQPTKALDYLDRAGENAFSRGANREAIAHLERAQRLAEEAGARDEAATFAASRRLTLMGEAHMRLGELAPSRANLRKALEVLGRRIPAAWLARKVTLAREILRQVLHLVVRPEGATAGAALRDRLAWRARIAGRLSEHCFYELDVEGAVTFSLASMNEAESAGDLAPASNAYVVIGFIAGVLRLPRLARRYFAASRQNDDASSLARADISEGALEWVFARWARARELIHRGAERARLVNDQVQLGTALESLGAIIDARNPPAALELHRQQIARAKDSSNIQHEMWGLLGTAAALLARNDPAAALAALRRVEEHVAKADPITLVRLRCLLPLALLGTGDRQGAVAAAGTALAALRKQPVRNPSDLPALAALAQTALALLETSDVSTRDRRATEAKAACSALRAFARQFPMAAARAWRLEGLRARIEGQSGRARRLWARAAARAREMDLPFDEAMALAELAGIATDGAVHRARAGELMAQLQAETDGEAAERTPQERAG